ncbi:Imm50 family immunity protein [Pseudomonas cedrina]|uniref:Imm50 family immunity protein n=1 Tax=Pseudomonas cedrina TaxID=651740 RepID=UPI003EDA7943
MKYWNELDRNIFFEKLFSKPVEIGKIALFSLQIENDQPSLGLGFDIPDFPDRLPIKWEGKGYNTCRMGIDCHGIRDLKIQNIPVREVFSVNIKSENNQFLFQATHKNSLIEFKAKYISLCDPNVYINGPDDYFF